MLLAIGITLYVLAVLGISFHLYIWVLEQFPVIDQPSITGSRVFVNGLFLGAHLMALASVVVLFLVKWYVGLLAIPVGFIVTRLLARLLVVVLLPVPERNLARKIMSGEVEPGLFKSDFAGDLERLFTGEHSERYDKQMQVLKDLEYDLEDERSEGGESEE